MSDTIDEATAAETPAAEVATEPDGSTETNGASPDGANASSSDARPGRPR